MPASKVSTMALLSASLEQLVQHKQHSFSTTPAGQYHEGHNRQDLVLTDHQR